MLSKGEEEEKWVKGRVNWWGGASSFMHVLRLGWWYDILSRSAEQLSLESASGKYSGARNTLLHGERSRQVRVLS